MIVEKLDTRMFGKTRRSKREREREINFPASVFQNSLPTLVKIYVPPFSYFIISNINTSDVSSIVMRESWRGCGFWWVWKWVAPESLRKENCEPSALYEKRSICFR